MPGEAPEWPGSGVAVVSSSDLRRHSPRGQQPGWRGPHGAGDPVWPGLGSALRRLGPGDPGSELRPQAWGFIRHRTLSRNSVPASPALPWSRTPLLPRLPCAISSFSSVVLFSDDWPEKHTFLVFVPAPAWTLGLPGAPCPALRRRPSLVCRWVGVLVLPTDRLGPADVRSFRVSRLKQGLRPCSAT